MGEFVKQNELIKSIGDLKNLGKKIVSTNGCFDILHAAHIKFLKKAKQLGDILVVLINDDDYIRKTKGDRRPIMSENERAESLASLKDVDFVAVFSEDTPLNLLERIKPDLHIKGGTYVLERVKKERELMEKLGGKFKILDLEESYSTTNVINKILDKYQKNLELHEILDKFNEKKILVIGDLMLDRTLYGDVSRICPEAPVPIVKVVNEKFNPGGVGNVAQNISALEGNVSIIGVIGNDWAGKKILEELENKQIDYSFIIKSKNQTIQKTRVIGRNQQLIRIDYENNEGIDKETENQIIANLEKAIPQNDIVVVSDYAKGFVNENVAKKIIEECHKYSKAIVVDTKPCNLKFFKDITILKPNKKEAGEMTGIDIKSEEDLVEAGKKLVSKVNSNVLITRGEEGMSLFKKNGNVTNFPTRAREVYDITGAGDTVVSLIALSMAVGVQLEQCIEIANLAAGAVVSKMGVATITKEEILASKPQKIVPKVWGEEHWLVNRDYCGKKLVLKKGYMCSLHYHKVKDETFYIALGKVLLELNNKKIIMGPGDSQRIKPGDIHRFTGLENSEIIEFSTHHEDEDSYRIEPSGKDDRTERD